METLNGYMKGLRKRLGLTQRELADILGVKRPNIAKYEVGLTMPPASILYQLQRLAGVIK